LTSIRFASFHSGSVRARESGTWHAVSVRQL